MTKSVSTINVSPMRAMGILLGGALLVVAFEQAVGEVLFVFLSLIALGCYCFAGHTASHQALTQILKSQKNGASLVRAVAVLLGGLILVVCSERVLGEELFVLFSLSGLGFFLLKRLAKTPESVLAKKIAQAEENDPKEEINIDNAWMRPTAWRRSTPLERVHRAAKKGDIARAEKLLMSIRAPPPPPLPPAPAPPVEGKGDGNVYYISSSICM